MLYVILIAITLTILIVFPFIRRTWQGNRLANCLMKGEFDHSALGKQFKAWFDEHASRSEQRLLFVQFALGMGCASGIVAERLMNCIMAVWRGAGATFGDELARELDRLIVFDPPRTPEQAQLQQNALQQFADFKSRLRSLDS